MVFVMVLGPKVSPGRGGGARILAGCGPLWRRAVAPKEEYIEQILHHPALAAAAMSHPGPDCWRPGSSWAAGADALLLGLGF